MAAFLITPRFWMPTAVRSPSAKRLQTSPPSSSCKAPTSTLEQVTANVQRALQARTTIEQAKGVLAYQHNLDMAAAYELLLSPAAADSNLTATAANVIGQAQRRSEG
jgi:hypothetical protein